MNDALDSKTRRLFSLHPDTIMTILSAIGESHRFSILQTLLEHQTSYENLKYLTQLGKSALSHHIKVLLEVRLIEKVKRGEYRITTDGRGFLRAIAQSYARSQLFRYQVIESHVQRISSTFTPSQRQRFEENMENLPIKIVSLAPMTIASVRAISKTPEQDAWQKMKQLLDLNRIDITNDQHPIFGFNNPDPTPEQPEYGYEFWVKLDPSIKDLPEGVIKEFPGGLYAVCPCNLSQENQSPFMQEHGMLESWFLLNKWVQLSEFVPGNHQWLEKQRSPPDTEGEILLDLYFPIMRKS